MSKGIIPLSILENIAKAIRYVNGLSTKYKPSEMENAIRGLKKSLGQKTITSNGTYSPSADNLDGYSEVTVTVEGGSVLVSKNIVQNGTYDPTDDNADGYSGVTVNVPPPVLVSKNITANGNYSPPDDNADGYSSVSVAVPGAVLQTKTATANGTVTPDSGYNGMSSVEVAVPNTYSAADDGKVVSDGALVAQTERTVAANGTYDTTENNSVVVNVETGALTAKDVNFIDYDGSIVYAYTSAQFAELSGMPANPSHTGLTAQGWNWTLADAQAHVASHRKLYIGQMYITDDNKTRLYIHLEQGRLDPTLTFSVSETRNVVIDWGDGSQTPISAAFLDEITEQHSYSQPGDYVIGIDVGADGTIKFVGDNQNSSKILLKDATATAKENACYQCALQKVELGNNVQIKEYAFSYCHSLASIAIPQSVTSLGERCFQNTGCLKSITIPNGVTAISNWAFNNCPELETISIPKSVSSIASSSLSSNNIKEIVLPDSVESVGSNAFYPNKLKTAVLPANITEIAASLFRNNYVLSKIDLPENVTSISTYAFGGCRSLTTITIPGAVENIAANAFYDCAGLAEIHFEGATPPAVANVSAWTNVPTDCKIYVPTGTLSAYTSAANYPSSATYTYIEE